CDDSKTSHDDTVRYRGPLHLKLVPIAVRAGDAWWYWMGGSGLGRRCTGALDKGAHPVHDRAYGLEVGCFFVGVVRNFDAEGVFDVEHDHRQVERLDLKIGQGGVEPDVVPRLL